jgi:ERCC4-type nuclease
MAKAVKFTGTIVIDTREQQPYEFDCATVVETLRTGDYSVRGLEADIVIERKTKADIYGSVTRDRNRFEREMVRLQKIRYAAIVIESSLQRLLVPLAFSKINPIAVINTLVSWSVKYQVHIWFAEHRRFAARLTYRLLEKAWRKTHDEQKK